MNPILSINIPTYNRSRYLKELLESIAADVLSLNGQIEINILDNASSDDTQSILKSRPGGVPIVYQRHERNLGALQNIHLAHRAGTGRYVWVMGDDDYLRPGQLLRIFGTLSGAPAILLLSYTRVTPDKRVIDSLSIGNQDQMLAIDKTGFDLTKIDAFIGFLSANIIERKWIDKVGAAAYDVLDARGELAHASIFYAAIAAGESVLYVSGTPLCQTMDNSHVPHDAWIHVCVKYCRYLPDELVRLGFHEKTVRSHFGHRLMRECVRRILSEKYRGRLGSAVIRDPVVREALGGKWRFLPVLNRVPSWVIRRVYDSIYTQRK